MSSDRARRIVASPWLTVLLAAILLALAGTALLLPRLIDSLRATASPSPAAIVPTQTPSPTVAGPTPSPMFVRPTPSPEPTFETSVVRPGDSLTSIARAFHTTPRSIAWWNRGTYPTLDPESPSYQPNRIEPGWILVLIPGTTVDENNPPTPSPPPAPASVGPAPSG